MHPLFLRLLNGIRPQQSTDGAVPVSTPRLLGWYARKGTLPLLRGVLRLPLTGGAKFPFFVGRGAHIAYGRQLTAGRSVQIGAGTVINAYSLDGVHIGDGVTIRENAWIQCSSHPSNPGAGLWIGRSTYIGPKATIGVGGPIRIGPHCQFGANVTLIAENHAVVDGAPSPHHVTRKGITIGERCWLGHGVTIVDGVTLGSGTVVGAGAVVTKSFPAGSRVAGVPARQIGTSKGSRGGDD